MISWAVMVMSTARANSAGSNSPSSSTKRMRLRLARLQALSSTCMYSEQGLLPLMRPEAGQVCQSLMVVSNCIPGSPHCHVASAISRRSSRARVVSRVSPDDTPRRDHSASSVAASMNPSVARTELFAFWNWIDRQASPFRPMS